jgi:hypothetical protein
MGFCPYLRHAHESDGGGPSPVAPLGRSPHSASGTDTTRFSTDLRLLARTERHKSQISDLLQQVTGAHRAEH